MKNIIIKGEIYSGINTFVAKLKKSMGVYLNSSNDQNFHFNNVKKLLEKETFNKVNKKDCTFTSFDLLHFGCSCGYKNG